MNVVSAPITGAEPIRNGAEPFNALVEFYRAFNTRDLTLMSANWTTSDEASMSNPLGGVRRGWESIQEAYSKIFRGSAEVYVEFYDYTIHHAGMMFCAVGRERGYFRQHGKQVDLAIRTSRFYRMNGGKWHQVHHHGSIDAPALLAEYQSAVFGQ
jgi:ketosteroid isomerase-like protein